MKTLAERWTSYRNQVLVPAKAGPVQVRETKRAFYAGAHCMLGLAVEAGDLEDEDAMAALNAIDAEIGEFVASIGGERES